MASKPKLIDPDAPTREWNKTLGTFIAGRAYIDEADATAMDMERKWGV